MKVVLLSPAHPLRGGIAASSERLAQAFQEAGHAVRIVSFRVQYPGFLFPGKTQYTDDPPPAGLHIDTLINSVNPLNWWRVGNALAADRPELVVVRYWLPFMGPALGTICRRIRRNGHTRIVALADNIVPHESRPGDTVLTRYFLKAMHGVVVMSRSVGDDARRLAPGLPVAYVPHPIYDTYGERLPRATALARLDLPAAPRYLLFFGFIRAYKGLDLLYRALADPRVRALPLRLLVAGEHYGDPTEYTRLAAELGIEDRLELRSQYIPNEAVPAYFGAADLVVQPYKTATQSGISQLAYHFEKPMLVTAVGGLPEIVAHGKAGYVVPVDPVAIADAIVDFFQHDRYAEFEAGVRAEKGRFGWVQLVEALGSVGEG